jgi:hypothetical protein
MYTVSTPIDDLWFEFATESEAYAFASHFNEEFKLWLMHAVGPAAKLIVENGEPYAWVEPR